MQLLILFALPLLLAGGLLSLIGTGVERLVDWARARHERKVARIERDLDQTQAELRKTILELAHYARSRITNRRRQGTENRPHFDHRARAPL